MDSLTAAAASGLRARMESLDMLANNLANAGASGYKADREFYSLYADAEAAEATNAGMSPLAGAQPLIDHPWTDFSQGILQQTDNPLHLALSGPGYFSVDTPAGTRYTRNGSFQLSPAGELTTAEGYRVRMRGNNPMRLDPALPVHIGEDGSVRQGGALAGQLEITAFNAPEVLRKQGNSYFQASAAGTAAAAARVHQGKLESANVAPAESAVRMVAIMRQFEMLQRAITLGGEMNRKAVEEVAKTNA